MADNKKRAGEGATGDAPQKKAKGTWQKNLPPGAVEKAIPAGAVGILITCDPGRDRRAADELKNMLDESFARLGKDNVGQNAGAAAAEADGKQSVEAMLAAEVADLKNKKKDRFKRHETNVKGTSFVEFPKAGGCPTPEEVVVDIARHIRSTQSLPSRHVMRILPVSQTCFVSEEDLKELAAKVAEQHFPADAGCIEFAVDFEHRACDKLKRMDVINTLANAVPQPPHKVNLNTPQKTIVVQLVRNVCAVGVVDDYRGLLRMNLRKLADGEEAPVKQPVQKSSGAATAAAAGANAETVAADKPAEIAAAKQEPADAAAGQKDSDAADAAEKADS